MIFTYDGPIENELLQDLTSAINSLQPEEPLHIYMCSTGGYMHTAHAAIDLINKCPNPVYYTVFGQATSAAFHMLYKIKRPRIIMKDAGGMIHQRYEEGFINVDGKAKVTHVADDLIRSCGKQMFKDDMTFLKKLGLKATELKTFKDGKDVFFTEKQLNQLLQNQTNGTNKGRKTTKGTRTSSPRSGRKSGSGGRNKV